MSHVNFPFEPHEQQDQTYLIFFLLHFGLENPWLLILDAHFLNLQGPLKVCRTRNPLFQERRHYNIFHYDN